MTPGRGPGRGADPASSRGLAVTAGSHDLGVVLVVCKAAQRLDILAAGTLRSIASVGLSGRTGHEVAVTDDGSRAYVPIYGSGVAGSLAGRGESIDVIDLPGASLAGTIDLPRGAHPHDARVLPDGRLLVTCEGRSSLAVLDTRDGGLLEEIRLPFPAGHMALVAPDGSRAFVIHIRPGVIVEVDLATGLAGRHLHVASALHRASLDVGGHRLFASEQGRTHLAEIDLGAMEVTGHVRLPGTAFASASTPEGSRLLAVLRDRSSLAVLDLSTRRLVDEVPMPRLPQSVVVDSADALAYVSCTPADRVVAVDLRSHAVVASTRVGAGADGLALTQGPGSTN